MSDNITKWDGKTGVNSLLHFEYPSDFYEACEKWPSNSRYSSSSAKGDAYGSGGDWAGTKDWDTASSYARKGWAKGVDLARPLAERLSTELVASVVRPEIHFDVTGDLFDMGRVMADEPECWMTWEDGRAENPNGPVHIVLDNAVSCGVSRRIIERRGAAVMALVMVLEAAGRKTRVDVVTSLRSSKGHMEFSITLKNFYDEMQYDALGYALINAAFFRRHGFRMMECLGMPDSYYGFPESAKFAPKGDIYMDRAHLSDRVWGSDAGAEKWVREQLAKQGVKFK